MAKISLFTLDQDKLGKNEQAVDSALVNGLSVEKSVPSDAKFTDTNYYINGINGSGNDTITLTRNGLSNLTVDLSHEHDEYSLKHDHPYDDYGGWVISDNDDNSEVISSGNILKIVGSGITTTHYDSSNNTITIDSTDTNTDTNYYLNDVSGSGNGTVTFDMVGMGDITWDASHTHDYNYYNHPTHPGDDFSVDSGALTGATVISDIDINVTTDTEGHVTEANGTISTRDLTLANLGYTGDTDANYYGDWNLYIDDTHKKDVTNGNDVKFNAGSNITLSYSSDTITISSSDTNTNYYLSSISDNGSNGNDWIINFNMAGGKSDIEWDASHSHSQYWVSGSSDIPMGNDTSIISFNDSTNETLDGYWSSKDGLSLRGDSNSENNVVVKTGYMKINNNMHVGNKIGIGNFALEWNESEESLDIIFE